MSIRRALYPMAAAAVAAEVVAYLLWRPRMLRWGATAEEASKPLPGDGRTPHPRVQCTRAVTIDAPPEQVWPWLMQMGIGRAGFCSHDWGAGVFVPVVEVEPCRHLVAQETFVLRPLPGGKTRLIVRYRGIGFASPAARAIGPDAGPVPRLIRFAVVRIPGLDVAARALDFFAADPLHHYMETGMLTGIRARAEGRYSPDAGDTDAAAPAVKPLVTPT